MNRLSQNVQLFVGHYTSVVARYLDEEAHFLAAVEKGLAAAERCESIEEEEMDARLEAMFKV